jgi:hypothetical protein
MSHSQKTPGEKSAETSNPSALAQAATEAKPSPAGVGEANAADEAAWRVRRPPVALWGVDCGAPFGDEWRALVAVDLLASKALAAARAALPSASEASLAVAAVSSGATRERVAKALAEAQMELFATPKQRAPEKREMALRGAQSDWKRALAAWDKLEQIEAAGEHRRASLAKGLSALPNAPSPEKIEEFCHRAARAFESELAAIFGPEAIIGSVAVTAASENAREFLAQAHARARAAAERRALLAGVGASPAQADESSDPPRRAPRAL